MDTITDLMEKYFYAGENGNIYDNIIDAVEEALIRKALERLEGNQIAAAKLLGVHRNTLHSKIKKYNIDIRSFKR